MPRSRTKGVHQGSPRKNSGSTELESDKLYFKIGEVAEIVGVAPHVLRYWETEFRAVKPQKSRSQQRVYRRRDVEALLKIKHLLYQKKFTIAGARQQLREAPEECETAAPNGTYLAQQSFRRVQAALDDLRSVVVDGEPAVDAADPSMFLRSETANRGSRPKENDLETGRLTSRPRR